MCPLQHPKHDIQALLDDLILWRCSNECLEELWVLIVIVRFDRHKLIRRICNKGVYDSDIYVKIVPGVLKEVRGYG